MSLFDSGVRPYIDEYLAEKSKEIRDYGKYWSASSAGYCQRKLIFERLGVPPVAKDSDARRTRVFEVGHLFHAWIQGVTKGAGLSIVQEIELQDEDLMVRGHADDIIKIGDHLILYDYKTQHSGAFTWQKGRPPSYFHRLQVGTYMYMLRKESIDPQHEFFIEASDEASDGGWGLKDLTEARILKIDKDSLRMDENQILWDDDLEAEVLLYWGTLNSWWNDKKIPPCTCHEFENGFMAKEKFNPYWYNGVPCSLELYQQFKLNKEA